MVVVVVVVVVTAAAANGVCGVTVGVLLLLVVAANASHITPHTGRRSCIAVVVARPAPSDDVAVVVVMVADADGGRNGCVGIFTSMSCRSSTTAGRSSPNWCRAGTGMPPTECVRPDGREDVLR